MRQCSIHQVGMTACFLLGRVGVFVWGVNVTMLFPWRPLWPSPSLSWFSVISFFLQFYSLYSLCTQDVSSFLVKSFSLWLFVISSFLWLCLLLLAFFLILFVYTRYVHPWKQLLGKKAKIRLLLQFQWCLQDKEVWSSGWHFQNKEVCSTLHMWKKTLY